MKIENWPNGKIVIGLCDMVHVMSRDGALTLWRDLGEHLAGLGLIGHKEEPAAKSNQITVDITVNGLTHSARVELSPDEAAAILRGDSRYGVDAYWRACELVRRDTVETPAAEHLTADMRDPGTLHLAEKALLRLAEKGGAWVSSAECSAGEIASAQTYGRWYQVGSLGFVWRSAEWLKRVTEEDRARGLVPERIGLGEK